MSGFDGHNVRFAGIAAAVPQQREDNAELTSLSEKSKNEIINQVGIRYRHVAPTGVTAADLCEASAKPLLNELGWDPLEVGILVFVSQTPDHIVPGTATQLQNKIGLPQNSICLDLNQGCAGYVYGMSVIVGMMNSFGIQKGLMLVGDTITKMVSENDNSIYPIFADAGSATAFELDENAPRMVFGIGSRGADFEAIHVPYGGFRNPTSEESLRPQEVSEGVHRNLNQLAMNGQAVFTFGLSTVASEIGKLLKETQMDSADIDYLVLHQANQFLNDTIARKVGFPKQKTPSSLHDYGNTSCATVPVTMVSELSHQLRTKHLKLMLSGFGVGLSWGNVILETDKVACLPIIEV
ncbi:MAG: ketoacyl-ACP synthase III [Flavobacteriales bacterium]|nr:ketoacyl-ACP synthase III [Flavobacteriales bacterium]